MQNRILTDKDRKKLQPVIEDMFKEVPEMMSRKIKEANVQQAFAVNFIYPKYSGKKILGVGIYEDTAYEYLKKKGLNVTGIDPMFDYDLHTFCSKTEEKYDIIFSVSVMEHVQNDEEFITDICKLLVPGGIAILTVDFREDYRSGQKKPQEDYRLYTSKDYARLGKIVEDYNCYFVDELIPEFPPDFSYGGTTYSFSTIVIKKQK